MGASRSQAVPARVRADITVMIECWKAYEFSHLNVFLRQHGRHRVNVRNLLRPPRTDGVNYTDGDVTQEASTRHRCRQVIHHERHLR